MAPTPLASPRSARALTGSHRLRVAAGHRARRGPDRSARTQGPDPLRVRACGESLRAPLPSCRNTRWPRSAPTTSRRARPQAPTVNPSQRRVLEVSLPRRAVGRRLPASGGAARRSQPPERRVLLMIGSRYRLPSAGAASVGTSSPRDALPSAACADRSSCNDTRPTRFFVARPRIAGAVGWLTRNRGVSRTPSCSAPCPSVCSVTLTR